MKQIRFKSGLRNGLRMDLSLTRFGPHHLVQNRVAHNGGRFKKRAIVALARKLLVALWKHVMAGVVIEGAVVQPA
jgi:hypothetical protein